jgi:2-polyprenyl-3-methyl-5-hydroxy-6-metoxy-1,4-benzoquinol methylase
MPHWWEHFFDDDYAHYGLASSTPEQIERIVNFIVNALALKPGQTVFDQCCGIGRLSMPLAQRGMCVVGVDQRESYIHRAIQQSKAATLACEFHVGDACEFTTSQPCDAAFNWFTSFGYSDDDQHSTQMLRRAFESLKPGGAFLLDYINVPRVLGEFRPWFIDRPTTPGLEGLIVLHESKPDFITGMLESDWTFLYPDGRRVVKRVATKMYMPHDLVRMLQHCGFCECKLFGSTDGEPFERTSRRCIACAIKPARTR